jgi:hypothetical protein
VDDATEEDWLEEEDSFDFIRESGLSGSLPSMKDLARKAFKYIKPGGYFESFEIDARPKCDDGTLPPMNPTAFSDWALQDWVVLLNTACIQAVPPRQLLLGGGMEGWMKEVGFVDVTVQKHQIPITPWASDPRLRQLGAWMQVNWLEALAGWSYKPLVSLGWSTAEIEVFLAKVRESLHNLDVHAYHECFVVMGKKPFPQAPASS